jgi:5-(carboxyamino)imidazole ribonucleotide mutase
MTEAPRVAVIMGSDSDWSVMADAAEALAEFDISTEVRVVSAHRTPALMFDYARGAADRGIEVIIAGAGGAAHLPGMVAASTPLPVIGVPVPLGRLDGLDSLLSIVQMPAGVPVATVTIGGARNAGLLAVRILGSSDLQLRKRVIAFQDQLADTARAKDAALQKLQGKVTGE